MTTTEFVTLVLEEVGAAWTRQKILEATNRAQNEILAEDNEICRVKPDPFFATTDGTYSYAASSYLYDSSAGAQGSLVGDVRTVKEIYSFSNTVSLFNTQTLDPASAKPNQVEYTPSMDRVSARISVVESKAASATDCVVKWWEGNNPGTTTVIWRARAYLWPTQLTAESIALTLPHDLHDTLLLYGVLKRLERREFGRNDDMLQQYELAMRAFRKRYIHSADQDRLGFCSPIGD